ncbi:MAG: type II toxin-antitoxin system HicB family antitoxin [Deltaproteobacteria bacterium]|nr:type II toxin-antitoxin system HicB family antitoxin [Deltaproteobacteria bacterium]
MEHYGFDVFWSEEDGGYIATCPDFPGLSAFGETEEQALSEGKAALRLFLDSLQAEGKRAPRATTLQRKRRRSHATPARLAVATA